MAVCGRGGVQGAVTTDGVFGMIPCLPAPTPPFRTKQGTARAILDKVGVVSLA